MPTVLPVADEIEQHRQSVTRYIRSLVRNAAEAEDLTQETLLRAHTQWSTLRDPAALASWLYRIATHITVDRLRQQSRISQRQVDAPVEELPLADQGRPSPLAIVQQNEMSECVQRYVAELSDTYRAVLLLHDASVLTVAEIAQMLHLPLTTVKMRLHRARGRMEAALKKACAFGQDERGVLVCEPSLADKPRT